MTETPSSGTPTSGTPTSGPAADSASGQERLNSENLKDYTGLRRSRDDRKIAGVAGGLGRHLNIDPTIVRVLLVVLVFFGGAGLLLYGAAWILVPEEGTEQSMVDTSASTRNALLIGAAAVAALLVLGDTLGGGFPWGLAWLFLVVAVLVIAFADRGRTQRPPTPSPVAQDAAGQTQQYAVQYPAQYASQYDQQYTAPAWYPPTAAPAPRAPRLRGPRLFGITVALIAIGLGSLGLYETAGGAVVDAAYPALALAITGLMLLVGSAFGRPGGLIALGVVALVALVATSLGNPSFSGERNQVERPLSAAQVQDEYTVPAGRVELDLTGVRDVAELDGRRIELRGNVGELVVVLPDGVDVRLDASIDFGGVIDAPGVSRDGWNVRVAQEWSSGTTEPVAEIDLTLRLRTGHIEVRQG
jgi:phage shock protein PspC (stress-responsive transcriptional regulator)